MIRLKFERTNQQLSQHTVASASIIAQPVISQIENGRLKPTAAQLARLAAVFNVPADELLRDVAMVTAR